MTNPFAVLAETDGAEVVLEETDERSTELQGFTAIAGDQVLQVSTSFPAAFPESRVQHLSICKDRYVYVTSENVVCLGEVNALRQALSALKDNQTPGRFEPQVSFTVEAAVSHVAFSADAESFYVAAVQGGLLVYASDTPLNGRQEIVCEPLLDLAPNPMDETAALLTSSGKLLILRAQTAQQVSEGVSAISWSKKGKQIMAGMSNGRLLQYTPTGDLKADLTPPTADIGTVNAINWLENNLFAVAYLNTEDDICVYILRRTVAEGKTSLHYTLIPNPSLSFGDTSHRPNYMFIPVSKTLILTGSTSSADIGMISLSHNSALSIEDDLQKATLRFSTVRDTEVSLTGLIVDNAVKEKTLWYTDNDGGCGAWSIKDDENSLFDTTQVSLGTTTSETKSTTQSMGASPFADMADTKSQSPFSAVSAVGTLPSRSTASPFNASAFGAPPSINAASPFSNTFGTSNPTLTVDNGMSRATSNSSFGSTSAFGATTFGTTAAFGSSGFGNTASSVQPFSGFGPISSSTTHDKTGTGSTFGGFGTSAFSSGIVRPSEKTKKMYEDSDEDGMEEDKLAHLDEVEAMGTSDANPFGDSPLMSLSNAAIANKSESDPKASRPAISNFGVGSLADQSKTQAGNKPSAFSTDQLGVFGSKNQPSSAKENKSEGASSLGLSFSFPAPKAGGFGSSKPTTITDKIVSDSADIATEDRSAGVIPAQETIKTVQTMSSSSAIMPEQSHRKTTSIAENLDTGTMSSDVLVSKIPRPISTTKPSFGFGFAAKVLSSQQTSSSPTASFGFGGGSSFGFGSTESSSIEDKSLKTTVPAPDSIVQSVPKEQAGLVKSHTQNAITATKTTDTDQNDNPEDAKSEGLDAPLPPDPTIPSQVRNEESSAGNQGVAEPASLMGTTAVALPDAGTKDGMPITPSTGDQSASNPGVESTEASPSNLLSEPQSSVRADPVAPLKHNSTTSEYERPEHHEAESGETQEAPGESNESMSASQNFDSSSASKEQSVTGSSPIASLDDFTKFSDDGSEGPDPKEQTETEELTEEQPGFDSDDHTNDSEEYQEQNSDEDPSELGSGDEIDSPQEEVQSQRSAFATKVPAFAAPASTSDAEVSSFFKHTNKDFSFATKLPSQPPLQFGSVFNLPPKAADVAPEAHRRPLFDFASAARETRPQSSPFSFMPTSTAKQSQDEEKPVLPYAQAEGKTPTIEDPKFFQGRVPISSATQFKNGPPHATEAESASKTKSVETFPSGAPNKSDDQVEFREPRHRQDTELKLSSGPQIEQTVASSRASSTAEVFRPSSAISDASVLMLRVDKPTVSYISKTVSDHPGQMSTLDLQNVKPSTQREIPHETKMKEFLEMPPYVHLDRANPASSKYEGLAGELDKIYQDISNGMEVIENNLKNMSMYLEETQETPQSLENVSALSDEVFAMSQRAEEVLRKSKGNNATITTIELSMPRLEAQKVNIQRLLRAQNDSSFAQSLKLSSLGPEHARDQSKLRRLLSSVEKDLNDFQSSMSLIKAKLAAEQHGGTAAPVITAENIHFATAKILRHATQKQREVEELQKHFSDLQIFSPDATFTSSRARGHRSRKSRSRMSVDDSFDMSMSQLSIGTGPSLRSNLRHSVRVDPSTAGAKKRAMMAVFRDAVRKTKPIKTVSS